MTSSVCTTRLQSSETTESRSNSVPARPDRPSSVHAGVGRPGPIAPRSHCLGTAARLPTPLTELSAAPPTLCARAVRRRVRKAQAERMCKCAGSAHHSDSAGRARAQSACRARSDSAGSAPVHTARAPALRRPKDADSCPCTCVQRGRRTIGAAVRAAVAPGAVRVHPVRSAVGRKQLGL